MGLIENFYFFVTLSYYCFVQVALQIVPGGIVGILKYLQRVILELYWYECRFLANVEGETNIPNLSPNNLLILLDNNPSSPGRLAGIRNIIRFLFLPIELLRVPFIVGK